MLTKSDLNQIGEVVESVVESKLTPIHKELKIIKKDIKYLKKTVDLVVKNYDEGDTKLAKRITKIEQHLST